MADRGFLYIVVGIVGIGVLLTVILVPISFSPVEYNEYGFKKSKSRGNVDVSEVYEMGNHMVGPDYTFIRFRADAHEEFYDDINVFTSDRLEVKISCKLQYFIRKHQMALLFNNYNIRYEAILRVNAQDALKAEGTLFTVNEYIRDRDNVERRLFRAVRERLGGSCCEKDCTTRGDCVEGCKAYERCTEDDFGLFVELRYFQLHDLRIPDELDQRYIESIVLQEQTETELLLQEAQLVRKETESLVKQIENEADAITQNATASSNLIISVAEANSRAIVEKARADGLRLLYDELGFTTAQVEEKASFDYLRSMRGKEHVSLAVDFQQLISGPLH